MEVLSGVPRPRYQFRLGGSRLSAVETLPPRGGFGFGLGCAVRAEAGVARVATTRSAAASRAQLRSRPPLDLRVSPPISYYSPRPPGSRACTLTQTAPAPTVMP